MVKFFSDFNTRKSSIKLQQLSEVVYTSNLLHLRIFLPCGRMMVQRIARTLQMALLGNVRGLRVLNKLHSF